MLKGLFHKKRKIQIGDVTITMGVSTPKAFDNSRYYVDYEGVTPKGVPFCSCMVRELSDPEHVVGDIGIAVDEDIEVAPPKSVLRESIIVDGVALDERVGL